MIKKNYIYIFFGIALLILSIISPFLFMSFILGFIIFFCIFNVSYLVLVIISFIFIIGYIVYIHIKHYYNFFKRKFFK